MKNKVLNFLFGTKLRKIIFIVSLVVVITIPIIIINLPKEDKICLVSFDASGGSSIDTKEIRCGDILKEPTRPIKSGFTFLGWYLDNNKYNFKDTINSNIVLKAKWQKNKDTKVVTVSFDSNGGSNIDKIEVAVGNTITEPIPPTKKDYTFKGWYLNDELFDFSFAILEDTTLVAHYEKNDDNVKEENREPNNSNTSNNNSNNNNSNSYGDDKLVKQLLGTWYYTEDSAVYFKFYYGYYEDHKCLYIEFENIDLEKGILYPTEEHVGARFFHEPFDYDSINYYLEENQIHYVNSNKMIVQSYEFTRDYKKLDLSQFDKFLGTWYLIDQENNDDYLEITKENENIFWVKNGRDVYLQGAITQKDLNESHDFFADNDILCSDGQFILFNNKTYSKEKNKIVIHLFDFSIRYEGASNVYVNRTKKFKVDPLPSDATTLNGYWRIKDGTVAEVDTTGLVKGLAKGSTEVCFYSDDLNQTRCTEIYVEDLMATKIIPDVTNIELNVGETKKVGYKFEPVDASLTDVEITADNPGVVYVEGKEITGVSKGTTKIYLNYVNDSDVKASITVTVKEVPVQGITINMDTLSLTRGESYDLDVLGANVIPSNATNKNFTWSSNNPQVAEIKSDRVVAIGEGEAIITAKTDEGNYEASVSVKVVNPPLIAKPSIGLATVCNAFCEKYVSITMNASGGSGSYNYSITIKKDGEEIGTSTNAETYLKPPLPGKYEVIYTITDTTGKSISGTTSATLTF